MIRILIDDSLAQFGRIDDILTRLVELCQIRDLLGPLSAGGSNHRGSCLRDIGDVHPVQTELLRTQTPRSARRLAYARGLARILRLPYVVVLCSWSDFHTNPLRTAKSTLPT